MSTTLRYGSRDDEKKDSHRNTPEDAETVWAAKG
jgi:hypothetical protein